MRYVVIPLALASALVMAQESQGPSQSGPELKPTDNRQSTPGWKRTGSDAQNPNAEKVFTVQPGTKILLSMINSISTKSASEGDRIYLETSFPILVDGKIVIPPGSYVAGTVTESKRPGRVKGRGELYVRFDSLTLPNGVTRDFRSRIGSLDGRAGEELDKSEGKIKSEGNKGSDARTVGETAAAGASVGALAGSVGGHAGMGAGIGAAAGAAAGFMGVLLSRGPEAILAKGTTLEMVLDRPLNYEASELDFAGQTSHRSFSDGGGPVSSKKGQDVPYPGRRFPLGLPY
jgi:type IV secretion system protein VirB10